MFVPQKQASGLVCSSNIAIANVMKEARKLQDQCAEEDCVEDSDCDDTTTEEHYHNHTLYHAAKSLRSAMKNAEREDNLFLSNPITLAMLPILMLYGIHNHSADIWLCSSHECKCWHSSC